MNSKAIISNSESEFQEHRVVTSASGGDANQIAHSEGARREALQAGSPGRKHNRSWILRYGATLFFVGIALVSSYLLQRIVPYPFPFLFFAAVMASAWFGGTGAGLFAVLASTAAVDYFLIPPFHSFAVTATNGTYFIAFIVCAFVSSWVSSSKKKDEIALLEARDQLEARVTERTTELHKMVQEREKTQQALLKTQAELAHLSRVLTMGELTASIAHEVNQPLTAVVTYGNACLKWLSLDPPNLEEARHAN